MIDWRERCGTAHTQGGKQRGRAHSQPRKQRDLSDGMKASGVKLMPPTDPALSLEAILQVRRPPASASSPLAALTLTRWFSASPPPDRRRSASPLQAHRQCKSRIATERRA
jgi:hypothetical protein